MPPKRKRMKLQVVDEQELKEEPISLMSLNDDCIRSILGKLALKEFIAASETCKRLQSLAKDEFSRHFKEKVMKIEKISDHGILIKQPKREPYIEHFEKNIQNVTLGREFQTKAKFRKLYNIYKTENRAPIKTLQIDSWGRGLRTSFGPSLGKMVKEVESLTIIDTKVNGDLNECLLKHMPNLKRLILSQNLDEPDDEEIDWLANEFPKLEYFAWHLNKPLPIDSFKVFLALNPNVKFFSLFTDTRSTLANLIDEEIHVNKLYFNFLGSVPEILGDLKILCENNLCDRLHLKFSDYIRQELNRHIHQFTLLEPYIEGLYFEKISVSDALARAITNFEQLKTLQLDIGGNAELLCNTPNLEEIFAYWGVNSTNFESYLEALSMYCGETESLKKIYIRNNSQPFGRFDFKQFDRERFELDDANKLKFFFKSEESSFTGKLSAIKDNYCMIELSRVETEHVNNPLITEYLTTKQTNIDNPWAERYYNGYGRRRY